MSLLNIIPFHFLLMSLHQNLVICSSPLKRPGSQFSDTRVARTKFTGHLCSIRKVGLVNSLQFHSLFECVLQNPIICSSPPTPCRAPVFSDIRMSTTNSTGTLCSVWKVGLLNTIPSHSLLECFLQNSIVVRSPSL